VDLAAELRVGEVVAGEDGPYGPAEFLQGEVDRVLGTAALGEAANRCRCSPLQPNMACTMACSPATVVPAATSSRRQISGLISAITARSR
jgi:hypothetical protein